ncbi:MAG: sigma-70 family RNA polymerase sigma factor [Bacteroidales bacterium]|nr:sigma-70 family RNA polymerase sigma factor [Bacteroidales bacterium]
MDSANLSTSKYLQDTRASHKLLYDFFAPRMYGICLRFAGNEMEANDILQEGFIKVFTKLRDFRNEGSLEGWIRRTIINTAINFYRRNLRYASMADVDEVEPRDDHHEGILDLLSREELLDMIRSLPQGYRTVFNLNVIEGYTHKEIGEMLQISDNTSKSQLARAKSLLRKKILAMNREKLPAGSMSLKMIHNHSMQPEKEETLRRAV